MSSYLNRAVPCLLLQSLLCDPNPNSPANSEAARLYSENRWVGCTQPGVTCYSCNSRPTKGAKQGQQEAQLLLLQQ